MSCANQINIKMCKIHNCATCEYGGDEEHCPYAVHTTAEDCSPTFAQMCEVYKKGANGNTRHVQNVLGIIKADVERVGLAMEDKCTLMTRTKFKTLINLLSSPMANGSCLRGHSIQSHLAAFKSITADRLEDLYEESGLDLPSFSIPKFSFIKPRVQEVSDRAIRKVEIEMEKWLASGKEANIDAYKFCFFALYCGMRAGDICEAKWNIIRLTTAGVMVAYVPRKTRNSTGAMVSFVMDNKTYCKIESLIGKPDEFIIPRHPNKAPKHVTKEGAMVGMHVSLRRRVNKMIAKCDIGNEAPWQKKTHALRKYHETERAMTVGREQAAYESGHSLRVQKQSYLGSLIGKVS